MEVETYTEDINRCMIRQICVDHINRFINYMRILNFTFEYRCLCSHLPSYTLSRLPKTLINIIQILACVASTNHVKILTGLHELAKHESTLPKQISEMVRIVFAQKFHIIYNRLSDPPGIV